MFQVVQDSLHVNKSPSKNMKDLLFFAPSGTNGPERSYLRSEYDPSEGLEARVGIISAIL